jgi:hypothetical protein
MMENQRSAKINGATYCRPEKKGMGVAKRTSPKYCPICGMHRRSKDHKCKKSNPKK